ncbi:MAG: FAD-dependent oxidoreductase [Defluviitoga tunisiensis]
MNYDVAIVGGGISGFHAAIAASRCGLKTLLIEKNSTIGGLTTLGLVNPFMKYWLDENFDPSRMERISQSEMID